MSVKKYSVKELELMLHDAREKERQEEEKVRSMKARADKAKAKKAKKAAILRKAQLDQILVDFEDVMVTKPFTPTTPKVLKVGLKKQQPSVQTTPTVMVSKTQGGLKALLNKKISLG